MPDIKPLFFLLLLSFFLFNCSDSDEDFEDQLLFTYEEVYSEGSNQLLLLTDLNGELLDSALLTESGVVKLMGPTNTEKFTITRIIYDDSRAFILTYFNTSANYWHQPRKLISGKVITLNVSEEMKSTSDSYLICGQTTLYNKDSSPSSDFYASKEDKVAVSWERSGETPKFAMYEDIEDGEELAISPEDFIEMELHSISSDMDWHLGGFYGKPSYESESVYEIGGYLNSNDQLYFPRGYFNYYQLNIYFDEEDPSAIYRSIYYGDLPQKVERIDIGNLDIPITPFNYSSTSSNPAVDMIGNEFYDTNGNALVVIGPNEDNLKMNELMKVVRELLPNHDFNLAWSRFIAMEFETQDYDQYVQEFLKDVNTRIAHKQYRKYNN